VTPISTATNTAGKIKVGATAITPNGQTAYVVAGSMVNPQTEGTFRLGTGHSRILAARACAFMVLLSKQRESLESLGHVRRDLR
jgi:hypothetical protein